MRRMLKRKIHPEALDVKVHKSDGQKGAAGIEHVANFPEKASESVSLLAMQGTYHLLSFHFHNIQCQIQ